MAFSLDLDEIRRKRRTESLGLQRQNLERTGTGLSLAGVDTDKSVKDIVAKSQQIGTDIGEGTAELEMPDFKLEDAVLAVASVVAPHLAAIASAAGIGEGSGNQTTGTRITPDGSVVSTELPREGKASGNLVGVTSLVNLAAGAFGAGGVSPGEAPVPDPFVGGDFGGLPQAPPGAPPTPGAGVLSPESLIQNAQVPGSVGVPPLAPGLLEPGGQLEQALGFSRDIANPVPAIVDDLAERAKGTALELPTSIIQGVLKKEIPFGDRLIGAIDEKIEGTFAGDVAEGIGDFQDVLRGRFQPDADDIVIGPRTEEEKAILAEELFNRRNDLREMGGEEDEGLSTIATVGNLLSNISSIARGGGITTEREIIANVRAQEASNRRVNAEAFDALRPQVRQMIARRSKLPAEQAAALTNTFLQNIADQQGPEIAFQVAGLIQQHELSGFTEAMGDKVRNDPVVRNAIHLPQKEFETVLGSKEVMLGEERRFLLKNNEAISEQVNGAREFLLTNEPEAFKRALADGFQPEDFLSMNRLLPEHRKFPPGFVNALSRHKEIARGFGFDFDDEASRLHLEREKIRGREDLAILRGQIGADASSRDQAASLKELFIRNQNVLDAIEARVDAETRPGGIAETRSDLATERDTTRIANEKQSRLEVQAAGNQDRIELEARKVDADIASEERNLKNFMLLDKTVVRGRTLRDGREEFFNQQTQQWEPIPAGAREVSTSFGGAQFKIDPSIRQARVEALDGTLQLITATRIMRDISRLPTRGFGWTGAVATYGGGLLDNIQPGLGSTFTEALTGLDPAELKRAAVQLKRMAVQAIPIATGEMSLTRLTDAEQRLGRLLALDDTAFQTKDKLREVAGLIAMFKIVSVYQDTVVGGLPVEFDVTTQEDQLAMMQDLQRSGFTKDEAFEVLETIFELQGELTRLGNPAIVPGR